MLFLKVILYAAIAVTAVLLVRDVIRMIKGWRDE